MDKKKLYKSMFLIAAIWNWIIGISLILISILLLPLAISLFAIEAPPSLVFIHSLFLLVIVVGIMLYFISREIEKYRIFALVGVIEKFLISITFIIYIVIGEVGISSLPILLIDIIFGCLFLEFLINSKRI